MNENNKEFVVGNGLNGEEITYAMLLEMEDEIIKEWKKSFWKALLIILVMSFTVPFSLYGLWTDCYENLFMKFIVIVEAIVFVIFLLSFFGMDLPARRLLKTNREAFLKEYGTFYFRNIQFDIEKLESKRGEEKKSDGIVFGILAILSGVLLGLFTSSDSKASDSSPGGSSALRKGTDNDMWCDCDNCWDYDDDCDNW